jgi:hypothetical protein
VKSARRWLFQGVAGAALTFILASLYVPFLSLLGFLGRSGFLVRSGSGFINEQINESTASSKRGNGVFTMQ